MNTLETLLIVGVVVWAVWQMIKAHRDLGRGKRTT